MTLGSEVDVKVRTKVALFLKFFLCVGIVAVNQIVLFFSFLCKYFSEKLYDFVFVCYN